MMQNMCCGVACGENNQLGLDCVVKFSGSTLNRC